MVTIFTKEGMETITGETETVITTVTTTQGITTVKTADI